MDQDKAVPTAVDLDQRIRTLDAAITRELTAGGRLLHRGGNEAIVAYGGGIGHWFGVLLTAGLWLLFYPGWHERRYLLNVNEAGRVWRRAANDTTWVRVDE
jgi:hypothetical protein